MMEDKKQKFKEPGNRDRFMSAFGFSLKNMSIRLYITLLKSSTVLKSFFLPFPKRTYNTIEFLSKGQQRKHADKKVRRIRSRQKTA